MTDRQWTLIIWEMLGACVVICSVIAARSSGRIPSIRAITDRLIAHRLGRYMAVLVWMWLGWHAFAR